MNGSTHLTSEKQQIADCFGQAAHTYHAQAKLQQICAERLVNSLDLWQIQVPAGPILEIGCGTGFVTQALLRRFPGRSLEITDLSADMLNFCQAHLGVDSAQPMLRFRQLDGEAIPPAPNAYALIVSGFAVQWFSQPIQSLCNLLSCLKPGGVLLISFPTSDSFPEWKAICDRLHLPYTANPLPDSADLLQQLSNVSIASHVREEEICLTFARAAEFFKDLKAIGAGFNQSKQQLTVGQMRQLIQDWDSQALGSVTVRCRVFYGALYR